MIFYIWKLWLSVGKKERKYAASPNNDSWNKFSGGQSYLGTDVIYSLLTYFVSCYFLCCPGRFWRKHLRRWRKKQLPLLNPSGLRSWPYTQCYKEGMKKTNKIQESLVWEGTPHCKTLSRSCQTPKVINPSLTLKRLGYLGSWKNSAVDRAITAKMCTMVVCDVIYKIVYLDFPK